MRIVLIHRYFWPDTPAYAHILKEIALALGDAGHQVTVLTCQPSYNRSVVYRAPRREQLTTGVQIRRWGVLADRRSSVLKVLNLGVFCVRILLCRELTQADAVMAASAPPIAIAKVASWRARLNGVRFIYHKQDIYPEVALAAGLMRDGAIVAVLRHIDARTDRRADRVVVLSNDMGVTLQKRGVDANTIATINNFDPWLLEPSEAPNTNATVVTERNFVSPWQPFTVVFAGNLGRFQNLETVIQAVLHLDRSDSIEVHFFGDGALRTYMEAEVAAHCAQHVHMHGYQSPKTIAEFLQQHADLGLVALSPGVIRAAYPSKTMTYLRHGCPILALVEAESDLARTLISSGAGFQADPQDPVDVTKAIRYLAEHRDELGNARIRAKQLYLREFGRSNRLSAWLRLFAELDQVGTEHS